MSKQKDGMTEARWARIKGIQAPNGRYKHVSCMAKMVPDPAGKELPWIPWIAKPGSTYNVGNNKAKRERRAQKRRAA